jgi:flagellar P-ring protein FlgI
VKTLRRVLRKLPAILLALVLAVQASSAPTVRIKDIARLAGVRDNQLVGYGLVVGLQGTGDTSKTRFTMLSVISMLTRLGALRANEPQPDLELKNVAAVIVTATLPPFAASGQKIDVTVSTIGDASSLEGGVLLQTPLQGADGRVYSVAQGLMSLGGGAAAGAGAAAGGGGARSVHRTTGRIPSGALVETEIRSDILDADGNLTWILKNPDFATATRLAEAINQAYRPAIARAESADRVRVVLPMNFRQDPISFISRIEDLLLQPDAISKVIVNERTGTIVFGENCRISTVAVSHGALSVTIRSDVAPNAPSGTSASAATVQYDETRENTLTLPEGANVRDLVRSLNSIGATPRDIIAVLQAIAHAGALHAELEFI